MMQNEKAITFDKLPEAVGYLTEQVIELKKMVSELKPSPSEKRVLIEIEDACRIIHKAKATIYTLVRKGILPAYKKGKNSTSTRMNSWHGLKTDGRKLRNKIMTRCWQICKMECVANLSTAQTFNFFDDGKEND